MKVEPQKQHEWLNKLLGEWTVESECSMGPDKPSEKFTGTESVRSLGGLWVVCEGTGEMPGGGGTATTIMTLGFDTKKNRYVGTFVGSMMTHLWTYEGAVDAAGKKLTLDTVGPDFSGAEGSEDKMAQYKDAIEFQSDDHRVLTSHMLGPDGKWTQIVTSHYRRKK